MKKWAIYYADAPFNFAGHTVAPDAHSAIVIWAGETGSEEDQWFAAPVELWLSKAEGWYVKPDGMPNE